MGNSNLIGLLLCFVSYGIGLFIHEKTKIALFNPFLISIVLVVSFMLLMHYRLEQFLQGANYIAFFLLPATCVLALTIYRQQKILKKYFLPSLLGCAAGSVASMLITYGLCVFFQLDHILTRSTLPRSITSAIAADVSTQIGGISSITLLCVVLSGVFGAMLIPILVKLLKLDNAVAIGIGLGSASHVLGTSKAVELGEVEGAMSSIALSISGILTVGFAMFLV